MLLRFAAAITPRQRLKVTFDYADGAAACSQPHPSRADRLIEDASTYLISIGDQLLEMQSREPLKRPRAARSATRGSES